MRSIHSFARVLALSIVVIVVLTALGSPFFSKFFPVPKAHAAVSGFVTRSGSQLQLGGSTFRFSGANIYWLGLDENVGGYDYPTQFRVDDAMATAQDMGATVVRTFTALGIGCSMCIESSIGNYNETALQKLDYAIKSAGDHGIRLVLPLVDRYSCFDGGIHEYVAGGTTSGDCSVPAAGEENTFYTSATIIGYFEDHISQILNRVNTYTGVAYKNDPTIMAWETGNELSTPPTSWTQTIANYIKGIDSNHLVIDGTFGINASALSLSNVDIYSNHYYPMSVSAVNSDAATVTGANKVFYVGEYGWTSGDSLSSFLSAIETHGAAGDTYWSLFSHDDTSGYVQHSDGYTLHYPGDTTDMRSRAQLLRTHAYTMQGISSAPAENTPAAPLITSVTGNQIAWRGADVADTYSVERSTTSPSSGYSVICNRCTTDNGTPWTDTSQPAGAAWYRVQGYNLAAAAGPYSDNVYEAITDPLNDWNSSILSSHTANLGFDSSSSSFFNGDTSRAKRINNSTGHEEIAWHLAGVTTFQAVTYFWPGEGVSPFTISTSTDGTTYTSVTPAITGGSGNWPQYIYTLSNLSNVNYVKMTWNNTSGQPWSPQISQVTLARQVQLIDPLNDLHDVYSADNPLQIDSSSASFFNSDAGRAYRGLAQSNAEIVWHQEGMTSFQAITYFWPGETVSPFSLYTSQDGITYSAVTPTITGGAGNWPQYTYTLSGLSGVNYVKMRWNNTGGQSWSPQISQVTLTS